MKWIPYYEIFEKLNRNCHSEPDCRQAGIVEESIFLVTH